MESELNKIWLITGISGQDGSWFADYLLELGYTHIHGILRRSSTGNTKNIDHILHRIILHDGDLLDGMNIHTIISTIQPDYIVNFAAQSHVKTSHEMENYTFQVNTLGVLHILQSVRRLGWEKKCRIYHASTSEMYGNQTNGTVRLNEHSPMEPVSVYGISKKAAHDLCTMYRNAYGMFIVSSILFNHEGPRRGKMFVTQKIADYVAQYHRYKSRPSSSTHESFRPLQLGNLHAKRDWGDAKDYMRAIYLMLRRDIPENYVIATGETHSVREFIELAFSEIGVKLEWIGKGKDEMGIDISSRQILVQVNPEYYRDIDIDCLIGDATKAKTQLGWTPTVSFPTLVSSMVHYRFNI